MVFFLEIEDAVRGANEELQLASAERRLMEDEQSRERQGEGVGGQRISGHNSSFAERLSRGGRAPPKPVLFTPMAKAPTAARYPPTGEGLREAIKHGSLGGVRTVVHEERKGRNGLRHCDRYVGGEDESARGPPGRGRSVRTYENINLKTVHIESE